MSDENNLNLNEITDTTEKKVENPYGLGEAMAGDVTAIYDIPVQISAVLGRSTMQVSQLLKLGRGAVVELDPAEAADHLEHARLHLDLVAAVRDERLGRDLG